MHAISQYEFGTPDVLRYETVSDPHAGPGQVRIAVDAAGVHVVDTVIRRGDRPIGRAAFELLRPGARLARFGATSGVAAEIGADEFAAHGVTDLAITGAQLLPRLAELESAALDKAASGAWRPLVQDFALARAADAHRALECRATTGKVVLVP